MCLEAIRVDPKYGAAYCQLGDVYKDSENINLALQAYLQGIFLLIFFNDGEAYCQLGDICTDSENMHLALQACLQGIPYWSLNGALMEP